MRSSHAPTFPRFPALAVLVSLLAMADGCRQLPRCWSRDDDVDRAIPAAVSRLAPKQLGCSEPVRVSRSTVTAQGIGMVAVGCGRSVHYACTCADSAPSTMDECKSYCLGPTCEVTAEFRAR
jgi:hypothetical protein